MCEKKLIGVILAVSIASGQSNFKPPNPHFPQELKTTTLGRPKPSSLTATVNSTPARENVAALPYCQPEAPCRALESSFLMSLASHPYSFVLKG